MQHTLEPRHFEFLVDASGLELKSLAAIGWMLSNPMVHVLPGDLAVGQVLSLCALGAEHCLTIILSDHREPEDEEALFWLVDRWSTEEGFKAHREVLGNKLATVISGLRHAREKTGDSRLSPLVFVRKMALGEFDYLTVEDAAHPKQGPSHVG
jgi:hypothetical protein